MARRVLKKIIISSGSMKLQEEVHKSVPFGVLLAIVGGMLDAYTFIGRGGVFANAQTGNIVLVGVYAAQQKWGQAITHMFPILAFILGVVAAELIKEHSAKVFPLDWKMVVLIVEMAVLFVTGFIPQNTPNIIVAVIISFVSSVQISSFRTLVDSPYSTTMCTGNLRSASHAALTAITRKDRQSAVKAVQYFTIIFSFLFGAVTGGLLTSAYHEKAVLASVAVLFFAAVLFSIFEREDKDIDEVL